MSSKLIAMEGVHDFPDNLKSTLYILLWMALMYSHCSDTTKVAAFMDSVLDPQVHNCINQATSIYSTKPKFLKGRVFLEEQVKFLNQLHLDELLDNLAQLFAVCYEKALTAPELAYAIKLLKDNEGNEGHEMILCMPALYYHTQENHLKTHKCTIKYFNDAL